MEWIEYVEHIFPFVLFYPSPGLVIETDNE